MEFPITGENKHYEILVSCSNKERNCIQTHETACKLIKLYASSFMELHVSSWNFMKAQGTACKPQGTACKLMDLNASSCNSRGSWAVLLRMVQYKRGLGREN